VESAQSVHRGKQIIIMQAANPGLTGGSTPEGSDYDRDIVIDCSSKLPG
jgi:D-lactate dehydrogenase (quinone)